MSFFFLFFSLFLGGGTRVCNEYFICVVSNIRVFRHVQTLIG